MMDDKFAAPPGLVATLRGLGLAIAGLVVQTALDVTNTLHVPARWAWVVPIGILAERQVEGLIDQARGQAPQKLSGSKPANPLAYTHPTDFTADMPLTHNPDFPEHAPEV